jgi:hypothetical protein
MTGFRTPAEVKAQGRTAQDLGTVAVLVAASGRDGKASADQNAQSGERRAHRDCDTQSRDGEAKSPLPAQELAGTPLRLSSRVLPTLLASNLWTSL